MKDWLIAHRGAQKDAPENTRDAFIAAAKLPVNYIELDIHTTKDGIVICNHDFKINDLDIDLCSYKQLKSSKPLLTTFNEAIRAIDGKRPLIVEIKPTGTAKNVINILKKYPKWRVTSYKIAVIKELIDLGIEKDRLILLQHNHSFGQIKKAKKLGVAGISVNQRLVTPRIYWKALDNNLQIYTYVVNSRFQAKLFRLLYPKMKIFTDRPDILKRLK